MPLSPGDILDQRYRVVKLLGEGGFGAVYRVWDLRLSYPRALKENLDTSTEARRQFTREAQILTALSHPNLPKVIDHLFIPGQGQYLVMDFVEGEDLQATLARTKGPLPEWQALEWIGQICDALEYLHAQSPQIIHRDIKPANIKITPQGKAMLVDFGIAKVYDPQISTTMGARAISPGYSPQEQYGMGATDQRTDIYAIGATLYHLLTGVPPLESIQRNIRDTLDPPRDLNPRISESVERAILKATATHPDERFDSIGAFKRALFTQPSIVVRTNPSNVQTAPSVTTQQPVRPAGQAGGAPWKWIGGVAGFLIVAAIILTLMLSGGGQGSNDVHGSETALAQAVIIGETLAAGEISTATAREARGATETALTDEGTPVLQTESAPTALPGQLVDDSGAWMALVPEGAFEMGYQDASSDERPVHNVYLDTFYMDITEVVNSQFAEFLNVMGNQVEGGETWLDADDEDVRIRLSGNLWQVDPGYEEHPVIEVTWFGANAFCAWRGARLPTEAEWEKAARGVDGRVYPWGAEFDCKRGNFDDETERDEYVVPGGEGCDGYVFTAPVGSFPLGVSPYEIHDMAGNVWEWVADWYADGYYSISPVDNPTGPANGQLRVLRGGSWVSDVGGVRATNRLEDDPIFTRINVGFRCARSP